ncbi:MAG TPA: phospholipase D-like domain-containing protein [Blastocatellia bacterium]|nr:phospholipase D-like domain-containing protein [Blastocatellia bacterium]
MQTEQISRRKAFPHRPHNRRRYKARRRRTVKGIPGWWARLRRLIWSWWLWAALAAAAYLDGREGTALIFVVAAFFFYIFSPREMVSTYGLDHEFEIDSPEFLSTVAGATGAPFLPGNSFDIYNNGDEFYPAMMDAIKGATSSITIEAYIYWNGEIGRIFAEALAAKAREGLPVKILLDAVGSSTIGPDILRILEQGGCQVEWYHPVRWYNLDRVNNRTHRKSLIIDGRVGFTGGAGIADHWLGNAQDEHHWRDIQVRIEGPATVMLQTGFTRNWLETTGELVSGPDYFPMPEERGNLDIQGILSSPETGSSTVRIMYYLSIVCARRTILIANPYFVPDRVALDILIDAKRRGVDVKVMVAGVHNDSRLARLNSIRLYGELLREGIEVHEYDRTMLHHKYMVCDSMWSTIGTTNFDNRALALNEESNICLHDPHIAARFEKIFCDDLSQCKRIELNAWRKRSAGLKAAELIASFLKEQV